MNISASYDLIVIGCGPGGEKAAARAAYELGPGRVAVVEARRRPGGSAAGSGIPAKVLRETALNISGFRKQELYGVDLRYREELDVQTFLHRERSVRRYVQTSVQENLERHGIVYHHGIATFADEHVLRVRSKDATEPLFIRGDIILIATGSRPLRPDYVSFDAPGVYDASTILGMHDLPRSLTVIGGGIVGCEFACLFAALGLRVNLVHSGERFFPFADREISDLLYENMTAAMQMHVHLFSRVASVTAARDAANVEVQLETGDVIRSDALLVATGRRSNTEHLHLERAGVSTGRRGLIDVNEHYQTNVPHIYAVGDVIGFPGLSSTAMEQGRHAVTHAFRFDYKNIRPGKEVPFGIWTIPEISMLGESEASLSERREFYTDGPPIVGRARFDQNPRGLVIGERGLLKLIFAPNDLRLLGVHIIGPQACDLIAVGLCGIEAQMTAFHFVNMTFNFPSLADLYKYAAYDAIGEYRKRNKAAS